MDPWDRCRIEEAIISHICEAFKMSSNPENEKLREEEASKDAIIEALRAENKRLREANSSLNNRTENKKLRETNSSLKNRNGPAGRSKPLEL